MCSNIVHGCAGTWVTIVSSRHTLGMSDCLCVEHATMPQHAMGYIDLWWQIVAAMSCQQCHYSSRVTCSLGCDRSALVLRVLPPGRPATVLCLPSLHMPQCRNALIRVGAWCGCLTISASFAACATVLACMKQASLLQWLQQSARVFIYLPNACTTCED
jgi:hypothetical protein